jgi:hypothetical protein
MRRTLLRRIVVPTAGIALLALALVVSGAGGGNGNGKGHRGHGSPGNGQTGYHFLVLDAVSGTADRMLIQGDGTFNANQAHGGGTFDHFQMVGGPPLPIVASGTWSANDVVSFTPSPTTHGVYEGGVLVMHATFYPNGQAPITNVTIEVDCNLGPIGFSTGKTEGTVVTFPGGPVFGPTAGPTTPFTGITIFTVGQGKHGD